MDFTMVTLLTLSAILVILIDGASTWKTDRRPKLYGDRIPKTMLDPSMSRKIQDKIVMYHNYFRSKVKPKASNMLEMKWHEESALDASRWSSECEMLTHDNVTGRWTDDFGSCGQNIFISTHQVPWYFAIKTWFLERDNFTYGSPKNDLGVVGHYTQMVWASTHEVGCGFSKCHHQKTNKTYYSYVCNYCPIGNYMDRLGHPYKKGLACQGCKGHCSKHQPRLCTNSCPVGDLWVNCHELSLKWPRWLCKSQSKAGKERRHNCKATCQCKGKVIY